MSLLEVSCCVDNDRVDRGLHSAVGLELFTLTTVQFSGFITFSGIAWTVSFRNFVYLSKDTYNYLI